jgi:hypothetical protein
MAEPQPEERINDGPLIVTEQFGVPLAYVANYEGVATERKFHDAAFAIIFALFLGACIGIGAYGFAKSDKNSMAFNESFISQSTVSSLEHDVPAIVGLSLSAVVLALGWLVAIRQWPKFMIYLSIIVAAILLIGLGILQCIIGFGDMQMIFLGIWGVFCIIMGLLLLVIAARRGASVDFTAVVLREAGDGLRANTSLMWLVSPLTTLAFLLVWVAGLLGCYFLFLVPGAVTSGTDCASLNNLDCDFSNYCSWNQFSNTCANNRQMSSTVYLCLVIIFGLYWIGNFKIGFNDCVTAGTIARWYFTRHMPNGSNVLTAVKNAAMASGSLAFGSLLITIVQFCRMLLTVAMNSKDRNVALLVLYCCMRFMCWILESLLRYITRYANIYIAMNGTNFWGSCKSTFNLLGRQSGWQAVMNDVLIGYLNITGALVCMGVPTALCFLITGTRGMHWISIVIVALTSFMVFIIFARNLRTAVDTIFVCFLEDMERNANGMTFLSSGMLMGAMCRHSKVPPEGKQFAEWQPDQVPITGTVVSGQPVVGQPVHTERYDSV